MKVFNFKSALAMLTFSTMSLFFQAPTQAQVNKQLLSDVIKSCQRDMSIDYFKRMGILVRKLNTKLSSSTQESCISYRYLYGSVIEQLPWLPDSGGILPSYPASVALSLMLESLATEERILECVSSKDFDGGNECSWIDLKPRINPQYRELYDTQALSRFLPYVCPKCVVANDDASRSELNRGFINWFLSLDKSKRRDVVSFLSSGNIQQNLQYKMRMAVRAYEDALKKIEQDDKEQRRRNLLGQ